MSISLLLQRLENTVALRWFGTVYLVVVVTLAVAGLARSANGADEKTGRPSSVSDHTTLEDAIFGGKVVFDLRVRAEIADQDGLDTSKALTERIRLGYGSKPFHGWSFYLEIEDIRSADDDRYNAAGLNANPGRTVVADPPDTELNQGYLSYDWKDRSAQIIFGRQRLILDDARFVGNVGWRQNEQTFDAVTIKSVPTEDLTVLYGFLWDVNRILGPDANADFDSESHLIHISYRGFSWGRVAMFGYHWDFDHQATAAANSSDTFGVRLSGKASLSDQLSLSYAFSYAHQVDAGDNATDYKADYYFAEGTLSDSESSVGAGYEVLGSDGGRFGFRTPLATGHKFNGWADVFLTTPRGGLQNIYLFAGTKLPGGIGTKVIYHWFWSEEGGGDFGEELNVILNKSLSAQATAVVKFASFDGDANPGAAPATNLSDRYKFWFQLEYKF